jgi:hypothetical protein
LLFRTSFRLWLDILFPYVCTLRPLIQQQNDDDDYISSSDESDVETSTTQSSGGGKKTQASPASAKSAGSEDKVADMKTVSP